MNLTNAVVVMMLQDSNRWSAVKSYAERNNISEYSALETAANKIEPIENFDDTLTVNFADAMYNWLIAQ